MRHDGPDDVRPTGHLQIKGGPHGRVWYALWRDADGRHQKRLGPAHVRDSGRRTARGAVVWWAANGSKPDADHLTPAEADTALRELLDTAVREPTDPAQRAPPCLDAFRIGHGGQAYCALRSRGRPLDLRHICLDLRDVGLELLPLELLGPLHRPLDLRAHVGNRDDDEAGRALVELLTELLEIVAAHARSGMTGHCPKDGTTGRRAGEQAASDSGKRKQRDDQPGG